MSKILEPKILEPMIGEIQQEAATPNECWNACPATN